MSHPHVGYALDDDSDDEDEGYTAPRPRIPDPYDDRKRPSIFIEMDLPGEEVEHGAVGGSIGEADAEEAVEEPHRRPRKRPRREPRREEPIPVCLLMRLPLEIKDEIYRYILVVESPILVHNSWKRVYARKRPGIETAIMSTNKTINSETVRILYGENRFLYRLRDPPMTRHVVNVEELSLADDGFRLAADDGTSDTSNDEFDPGNGYDDADTEYFPRGRDDRINIDKFRPYFRHLIVEAERNRYSNETQLHMADAIKIFTAQPSRRGKTRAGAAKTSLQTFTIRIAPQYGLNLTGVANIVDQNHHNFTFVNFFSQKSPVLDAIKSLSCQCIKVDLLTSYLNGGHQPAISRLTIDMHHLRFSQLAARQKTSGNGEGIRQDFWRNDTQVLRQRFEGARRSTAALLNLEKHVFDACERHIDDDIIQRYQDELDDDLESMDWEPQDDDEFDNDTYEEVRLGFDNTEE
ncbi:hypothetical protein EDB81DRAFT_640756 [Dactylonectria macrodidyma]|uniref:Uncharacterized protein n=1 Tax=Dactylonectria macrodidyma TaxID=307937 RepID=A0A9P9FLF6_9HYPO|nr:hypothetical protein EDB81DRAFT_640756 [Dactylonectria macrodidyma]